MRKQRFIPLILAVMVLFLSSLGLTSAQGPTPLVPLGTAFTYQGYLTADGHPMDGTCDFRFTLWDASTGGAQVGPTLDRPAVSLLEGRFTVRLDFGGLFDGTAFWLEVAVRCPPDAAFTTLSPRQELTQAPYAGYSLSTGALHGRPVMNVGPAVGQVLEWDGASWTPAVDDDTTYSAGAGLILTGTVFLADTTYLQRRVQPCGDGFAIRQVNEDGSVVCALIDNTTYEAGFGLILSGTVFLADPTVLQQRVGDVCGAGSSIRQVNQDGTVVCEPDDDTTYTAGTGLELLGTVFRIAPTYRLPQVCSGGQITRWDGLAWVCSTDMDSGGDITAVYAGDGLLGGGTTGDVTVTVDFAGTGSATTVARSDHDHDTDYAPIVHRHDHGADLDGLLDDDHPQYFHLEQDEIVSGTPSFVGGDPENPPFFVDSAYPVQWLDADLLDWKHEEEFFDLDENEVVTGTPWFKAAPPFTVTSSLWVQNLNADLLDGFHAADFAPGAHNHWGQTWSGAGTGLTLQGGSIGLVGSGTTYGLSGSTNAAGGYGVYGNNTAGGTGVYGNGATGVYGNGTNRGVQGQGGTYGVYGSGTTYGLYGVNSPTAVYGNGTTYGVYGASASTAVRADGGTYGLYADGTSYGTYSVGGTYGLYASGTSYGTYSAGGPYGVYGNGTTYGIYGTSASTAMRAVGGTYGVYASGTNYAGYFVGPGYFSGFLTKAGGGWKIDDPRDPANRYLYHFFVESADMKNFYDGVVTLDRNGTAWVELPEWFGIVNKDFRYQLTPIGGAAPGLYIAREIEDNRFQIAGGVPGLKVSWLVTGIRADPWAEANRLPVEVEKPAGEKGTYLHPELYGQPPEKMLGYLPPPAEPLTGTVVPDEQP